MDVSDRRILYECKGNGSIFIINQEDGIILHYSNKQANALERLQLPKSDCCRHRLQSPIVIGIFKVQLSLTLIPKPICYQHHLQSPIFIGIFKVKLSLELIPNSSCYRRHM